MGPPRVGGSVRVMGEQEARNALCSWAGWGATWRAVWGRGMEQDQPVLIQGSYPHLERFSACPSTHRTALAALGSYIHGCIGTAPRPPAFGITTSSTAPDT